MSIRKERIRVYEMTCTSCENRVEKAIMKLDGVFSVKASYSKQLADIEYDDNLCNLSKIKSAIKKLVIVRKVLMIINLLEFLSL